MFTRAVIYSKTNCPHCLDAEVLLHNQNIEIEKKVIGFDTTKEQLLEIVPNAKTVPQIFLYDENDQETYIGGYDNLKQQLNG